MELPEYWSMRDLRDVKRARTFEELAVVALRVLEQTRRNAGKDLGMVCGPITSGGIQCNDAHMRMQKNMERLARAQQALRLDHELGIFNQLVFENKLHEICRTPYYRGGMHLLEAFYLPLFMSGKIKCLYFMPTWETSTGSRWEHTTATRLKLPVRYLRYAPCGELEIKKRPVLCPARSRHI